MAEDGEKEGGALASSPAGRTSARARRNPDAELGKRFADLLEGPDAHQIDACAALGIPWRTHMDWMAANPKQGSDLADYQSEVLKALGRQRRLDLEGGQESLDRCHPAKAGAQFNMFRFRHEARFRRFYADDSAHKVEISGPNGGPIETSAKQALAGKLNELRSRVGEESGGDAGSESEAED